MPHTSCKHIEHSYFKLDIIHKIAGEVQNISRNTHLRNPHRDYSKSTDQIASMTKDMKKLKSIFFFFFLIRSIYYNLELFESLKIQIGTIQKSTNQIALMTKGMKKIKRIYYKLELTVRKNSTFLFSNLIWPWEAYAVSLWHYTTQCAQILHTTPLIPKFNIANTSEHKFKCSLLSKI